LWQTDSAAVRAQRWFGFERTGADGVVLLSGASWGATGSGS
jgi:hypothetical protein